MEEFIEKLKKRWEVETLWHVVLILFIFSITGMTSLYVSNFFFEMIGVNGQTAVWKRVILWLVIEVPTYQILFLGYGFLLGQFNFVWRFEKKAASRIKNLFSSSKV